MDLSDPNHPHFQAAVQHKLAPDTFKARWRRHGDNDDVGWTPTDDPQWARYNDYVVAGHEFISFGDSCDTRER